MNSRSNLGGGSFRLSGPRISVDVDSPKIELTPEAIDQRPELIDSDVEPGLDSHRSTYDTPSARDGPGGKSTGPRREANDDISDGEAPSSEAKKPMVKKWSTAEDVKRENPKKRFDYGKVPYERIFPKDEDIAKGNYKLTPQNNALIKEVVKPKVGSGDEERTNGGGRHPRGSVNKVEPQKIREYKGSDYEPKLHKYDTAYAYDRCDSPYALNYLNSKGFSHAITEPGGQAPAVDGPGAAQPRTVQGDVATPGASPSSRRRRSVGGGCCCSKGAVEVDDQRPQVKQHHSPGKKPHTPEIDPGVHPGTVETEPVYVSTLRYTFKNPGLVRPHYQLPDFDSTSPKTKPQKAAVAVATPSAELRAPKPRLQTRAETPPPLKAKPRVEYRTTCCSDSDVKTIDSPRRSSGRIHYRTPTPEVDISLNKPVVKVHPPEKIHVQSRVDPPEKIHIQGKVGPPEKIHFQGKVDPPEKIHIKGKVDPPEKIHIQSKVDPPEKINIQGKVDPPEKIHIQGKVDPPEEIHVESPRVVFPEANFNNPRYTFRSQNPTLRAKGLKTEPTISRPSLRLAQPRTNYRVKTPPKLTFRRPRLSPIKPLRVNLRRSKPNEPDAPKTKPNTETSRPKNPKVIVNAPRVRLSEPRVKGPEIQKPAVNVRRPERPVIKVNAKKPTANATVEVPPRKTFPDLKIKAPRPVEETVKGPELEFGDPYHFSTEIPTPPSSRIDSPEIHLPRPDIRPPKPLRAEIRAPELSPPRAEIQWGATKPTIKPIETNIRVPEPKAEVRGDVTPPKISVKPKNADIPVTIDEPDFDFEGPDVHISDPEFQRENRPNANANTKAPVDAKFQPDAPRIRNPKVATFTPRSMIKPTFADLQINAPRSEVTEPDPPEVRFDATPSPPEFKAEVEKPSVSPPPTKPPTFYPPTRDLERPRPERNTISLPRLPQPPRASVKIDPVPPPKKQSAPPPRNPSPPEQVPPPQRSSPKRPPQQQPSPQKPPPERSPPQGPPPQRPPPTDTSRDQNPSRIEPIKFRLRPSTNKSPRGGGGGGDHDDVEPGLTYYPPSKATITHRILNGPLLKSRLT